jgi:DNA-directed RNA polymerase specialized sigma24 family protein
MSSQTDDSISGWLSQLHAGDAAAIQLLWDKFYKRLVAVADRFLTGLPPIQDDGEDVAASVFQSFWRGGKEGRFQNINDLDEAWWFLFRMAWRKCVDRVRRDKAQKRGGGTQIVSLNGEASHEFLEIVSEEPGPEFLASFNEQYFRLLDALPDASTRKIAVLMLQGHSANDISERTEIFKSTVRRKMNLVRTVWKHELDQ